MVLFYIILLEIGIMCIMPIALAVYNFILKPVVIAFVEVFCDCKNYYDKNCKRHHNYEDDWDAYEYESRKPLVVEVKQIDNSNLFEILLTK